MTQSKTPRNWLTIGALVALGVLVVFVVTRPEPVELQGIETFPDLGQEHIDPAGPAPDYNSNPATSGPHAPQPAPCGIYREEVPEVFAVHTLEHGAVLIQYSPEVDADARDRIEEFVREAGSHALAAPRAGLDEPVTLTAWTNKLGLDGADIDAIDAFYRRFARSGPEPGVQCPLQIDQAANG